MAGYLLIEEKMFQPYKSDGFPPNPDCLGLLDYLRELRQEVLPFAQGQRLRIVGVEDVMLAAGDNLGEVAAFIHDTMAAKANELTARFANVQVVFRYPLRQADDLWIEAGLDKHLSLRRIFDSPHRQVDRSGNEYYFVGFNLT